MFAIMFSLVSSPIKEKLYIGEASVATIAGVIFGPFCLNWFYPTEWGSETITMQISRIVLCIQIFAVAVELPKKYMKKHWLSVFILLVPVMTAGWLIIGLFVWIIFKPLNFSQSLLISGCITATDPVLAAAVVGKGKFAQKVPGHLRNLLSAESACNDGMAFPFIFLAMNLIIHAGNAKEIVKDWICVTILYECVFGCVLGAIIGWLARRAITLLEKYGTIDRESFLAFYVMLSFTAAGLGSVLGVDELLVAFAAGLAFSWNGQYAKKTDDAHVSTAIDLLLNLSYFVYLGAILPWNFYHQPDLGLPFWKYFLLALIIIFLRRIPAVLTLWKFTPDLNTWREALFAGHFGPIGVGAIYAVILARSEVEEHVLGHVSSLTEVPSEGTEHYHLILYLWPVVTFAVVASIVVHGSSVAVMVFGRRLKAMSISMTFTQTQGNPNSQSWMSRLPRIDTTGRSFSLHKVDTASRSDQLPLSQATTIETSGIPARPAGGMKRRKKFKKRKGSEKRERPKVEKLDLKNTQRNRFNDENDDKPESPVDEKEVFEGYQRSNVAQSSPSTEDYVNDDASQVEVKKDDDDDVNRVPTTGYQEGSKIIIDDQNGEVMSIIKVKNSRSETDGSETLKQKQTNNSGMEFGHQLANNLSNDLSSISAIESPTAFDGSQGVKRRKSHMGTIKKIKSNVSSKIAGSSSDFTKFTAYRVRDEIIIEDNEGEILKRYKIHSHHDQSTSKLPTTPTLRQRALTLLGMKPPAVKSKEEILEEGGSSAPILVPESGGVVVLDNALLKASDNRIQRKLLGLINDLGSTQVPKPIADFHVKPPLDSSDEEEVDIIPHRPASPAPKAYDFADDEDADEDDEGDEDEDESESEYDSEDDDEDDEEETEIERKRRLDALEIGSTVRNEDDEEEDFPTVNRSSTKSGGLNLKWHSDV